MKNKISIADVPGNMLFIISIVTGVLFILYSEFQTIGTGKRYFRTPVGRGAYIGVVVFTSVFIVLAMLWPPKATSAELYAGIDQTFNHSPQCREGEYSEKLTSNGGIRQKLYSLFYLHYLHHSCAINGDTNSFDSLAPEIELTLYRLSVSGSLDYLIKDAALLYSANVRFLLFQSNDKTYKFNIKYTQHVADKTEYDYYDYKGIGFEFMYRIF